MPPSRASANELARLLEALAQPVYVVNDARRLIFCNQACQDWTGVSGQELIGQECRYHSAAEGADAAAIAAALCPAPEAFRGRRMRSAITLPSQVAEETAPPMQRSVEFIPLGEGAATGGVLAIVAAEDSAAVAAESLDPARAEAAEWHALLQVHRRKLKLRSHVDRLWGNSPAMRQVRAQVRMAAGAIGNVAIFGPAGSGREHVARAIHYGVEPAGPLAPLACPLLDSDLLQATMRGLIKAAEAEGGAAPALLLADVDQLPAETQAVLAEALAAPAQPLRIFSTAGEELADAAARGDFRHDLACLLSTLSIRIPPLVERLEDLPLAAQWFVEQVNARSARQISGFSPESLDRLAGYHWPGDLDDLEALVAEVHARCEGAEILPRDLPPRVAWAADAMARPGKLEETIVLEEFLAKIERELIERALTQARGNKTKAARLLGMNRPRFYRRLVQLGFEIAEDEEAGDSP
ncbi:MAG TPA: helix-turn-helix domain-containing protein [Pirellulales bacterium]|nr:helix-turn-helix domain-containing protein [Pirellulales bacterium]